MEPETLRLQQRICAGTLSALFIEDLGWDRAASSFSVTVIEPGQRGLGPRESAAPYVVPPAALESHTFTLKAVAQKCGMTVFVCSPLPDGTIPNPPTRYRLQHRAMKAARENILVFTDAGNTRQVWQWVRRGADVPVHLCEHTFVLATESKALAQRLVRLVVGIAEEETGRINLAEIIRRVSMSFYNRRPNKNRPQYVRTRLAEFDFTTFDPAFQDWLNYVYSVPRLGRRKEQRLVQAAQSGDVTAKHRFLEANLYLVAEIAWKMTQESEEGRSWLLDLIQEGNLGLFGLLESFDLTLGYRFQTYAQLRIRRNIRRALHEWSGTIELPIYLHEWLDEIAPRYILATDRLWQWLGREPTRYEIACSLGVTPNEQPRLLLLEKQVQSLDAPENALGLQNLVDRDAMHCPFAVVVKHAISEELMVLLNQLNPRERAVIMLRFGLKGNDPKTLEEVGQALKVTRERIRQIESAALVKLRTRIRGSALSALLTS